LVKKYLSILVLAPILGITSSLRGAEELIHSSASIFTNTLYYIYQPIAILLPHPEVRKTLYATETQYFYIRVELDESGNRHLVFLPQKGSQSIYNPEKPDKIVSSYARYGLLALLAFEQPPQRVLFIGMGGGIMPMHVRKHFPETQIDIVEIDKSTPVIAEKYFDFKKDSKMNIVIEDGRVFANKSKEKYDIIFLDVYNAEGIPFQFTTTEFFTGIKEKLSKNGVISINLANFGKASFIASELNTIYDVFPNTFVFASEGSTNYIPISFNNLKVSFSDLNKSAIRIDEQREFNINFKEMLNRNLSKKELDELRSRSYIIMKDDFAPGELLK
jgi:spermidine synthase